MNDDDVRYRYCCDTCSTAGDWVKTPDEARQLEDQHREEEHADELVSTRIQRFPLEEIERGDVR